MIEGILCNPYNSHMENTYSIYHQKIIWKQRKAIIEAQKDTKLWHKKMSVLSPLSSITLNVSGLNSSINRYGLAECIRKWNTENKKQNY